jgi:hypothetical protein
MGRDLPANDRRVKCPLCEKADACSSGVRSAIRIRGYSENLITFTCAESHTFFLRACDVVDTVQVAAGAGKNPGKHRPSKVPGEFFRTASVQ